MNSFAIFLAFRWDLSEAVFAAPSHEMPLIPVVACESKKRFIRARVRGGSRDVLKYNFGLNRPLCKGQSDFLLKVDYMNFGLVAHNK